MNKFAKRGDLEKDCRPSGELRGDGEPRGLGEATLELIVAAFLIFVVVIACYKGFDPGVTDFRMFYSAARMIRHGDAHHLYDLTKQHAYQQRYAGQIGLVFVYPPATGLLYVPGAFFTMRAAYLLWTIASVITLALGCLILNAALKLFRHRVALFAAALLFVPLWVNFMNGQIVTVLLLVYSIALYCMLKDKEFVGGLVLAMALLKFHLVLPFVFVLLLRRRWSTIAGFAVGGAGFLGVCLTIAGWRFPIDYIRIIRQMPSIPRVGLHLSGMASLRGVLFGLLHHDVPLWLLAALSVALLVWVTRAWQRTDLGFATTIVATLLVSYHQNPQDLSLLLIPLAVTLKHLHRLSWHALPLVLWFAPPVPLFFVGPHFWVLGFAILMLLAALMYMDAAKPGHDPPPAA